MAAYDLTGMVKYTVEHSTATTDEVIAELRARIPGLTMRGDELTAWNRSEEAHADRVTDEIIARSNPEPITPRQVEYLMSLLSRSEGARSANAALVDCDEPVLARVQALTKAQASERITMITGR